MVNGLHGQVGLDVLSAVVVENGQGQSRVPIQRLLMAVKRV